MVQWRDNITSKSPGIVRTITPARVILNCIRPWPRIHAILGIHRVTRNYDDTVRRSEAPSPCAMSRSTPLDIVHEYIYVHCIEIIISTWVWTNKLKRFFWKRERKLGMNYIRGGSFLIEVFVIWNYYIFLFLSFDVGLFAKAMRIYWD